MVELYELREQGGEWWLFLNKKAGLKFKKRFTSRKLAEWFLPRYLDRCCLACKARGWAYKTRHSRGLTGGGRSGSEQWGYATPDSIVFCPECRARYRVGYDENGRMRLTHADESEEESCQG